MRRHVTAISYLSERRSDLILRVMRSSVHGKRCAGLFAQEFKNGSVLIKPPEKSITQSLLSNWHKMVSSLNKKRNYLKRVRIPQSISQVNDSLIKSPRKSQLKLSVKVGIKRSSCGSPNTLSKRT